MSAAPLTPNGQDTLFVDLAVDTDGRRTFTPRLPAPPGLSWNVPHRRFNVMEKGNYFLTVVAGPGLVFATPAIVITTPAKGITFRGQTGDMATIAVTSDYADEKAEFALVLKTGPDRTETIDPTILVEPPGGDFDEEIGGKTGTLLVSVSLDEDKQLVYREQVRDTPFLEWIAAMRSGRVSSEGVYYLVYGTDFELGVPAIEFPNGKPPYIELKQTGHLAILTLTVAFGQPHEQVPLRLNVNGLAPGINNDPTILVEPPGGKG